MQRVFLVLITVAAFLAGHGTAAAEDVVTPHCGCVSAPGEWLSSHGRGEAERNILGDNGFGPSSEPLWCEGPDDPRCAPMRQGDHAGFTLSVPAPGSRTVDSIVLPGALAGDATCTAAPTGRSRPEHARRIERPPQG